MAELSGGKYFSPLEAPLVVRELKRRVKKMKTAQTIYQHHDIWDTPLLLALLAVALTVEWFVRRRVGLM